MIASRRFGIATATVLALSASEPAAARQAVVAIRGADVHPVSGPIIPNAVVLIRNGKIEGVGRALSIPSGALVIDAAGMNLTPGVIDARTSFGVSFNARSDRANLVSPDRRMADQIRWPDSSAWLVDGVTAAYVAPDARNLIGGFGAVVKLAAGPGAVVDDAAALHVAFGESVLQSFSDRTTRQGMIGLLRQWLIDAGDGAAAGPDPVAGTRVLRDEVPLRVTAHTPDDIETALRLAEEFSVRLIIDGASGAHRVADRLSEAGVPVVVGPSILAAGNGGPFELFAHTPENAARLHEAGVTVALGTDAPAGRSVVLEAIVARGHGLSQDDALRAVTLDAARILGVDERLGSIEPGKDADLVLWRGDPISTWGEAMMVMIDGTVVYDRRPTP